MTWKKRPSAVAALGAAAAIVFATAFLVAPPARAQTAITRAAECEVTIVVPIEIHGRRATPELADRWKKQIEAVWNGPTEEMVKEMAEYVDVLSKDHLLWDRDNLNQAYRDFLQSMGVNANCAMVNCCRICIRVDIRIRRPDDAPRPGYHQVEVHAAHEGKWSTAGQIPVIGEYVGEFESEWFRSYVHWGAEGSGAPLNGATTGSKWADEPDDPAWAHEVGHLMGLDDDYTDVKDANGKVTGSEPKPGHDGHDLMASSQAWPEEDAFRRILAKKGLDINCCKDPAGVTEVTNKLVLDARNAAAACDRDMIQRMILELQAQRANIGKENIVLAVKFELVQSINATLALLEKALLDCPPPTETFTVYTGFDGGIWCNYGDALRIPVTLVPADEHGNPTQTPGTITVDLTTPDVPTQVEQPKLPPPETFKPQTPGTTAEKTPTTPDIPTQVEQPKLPPPETFKPQTPGTTAEKTPTTPDIPTQVEQPKLPPPETFKPQTPGTTTKKTPTPETPPQIPDTIFVKANEKVLQGGQTGTAIGGQTVKLFPPSKPDLPGAGTKTAQDTGFNKDPVECKTDASGGCNLKIDYDERPHYRLPAYGFPGRGRNP